MTFPVKRPNKYNARKVQIYGIWFDSDAEGKHYLVLKDRERKGEIQMLAMQPRADLVVNGVLVARYTADFTFEENGRRIWEDVKGFKARDFAIRSKLFQALHPHIELRVNGTAAKRPKAAKKMEVAA